MVMAMIIAWHTLNKAANGKDGRFSDAFLIVAPGITISDRLRVLLPSDPQSYYRERDIVPPDRLGDLGRAKIVITNFQLPWWTSARTRTPSSWQTTSLRSSRSAT